MDNDESDFTGPIVTVQQHSDELYETTVEMQRLAKAVLDAHPWGYATDLAEEVQKFLKLAGWYRK